MVSRCYPVGGLTPLLCLVQNAKSSVAEIGAVAMSQLLEQLRLRIREYASPLVAGLRQPRLDLETHVFHVVCHVGASLTECDATTDAAFYAWLSCETTRAVLENHAMYRSMWTPRLLVEHGFESSEITPVHVDTGHGRAA